MTFTSEEAREKAIARWSDPEARAKWLAAVTRPASIETRALLSEAAKKRWAKPEFRERVIPVLQEANRKPEKIAKFQATWERIERTRRPRGAFMADGLPTRCRCCGRAFSARRRPQLDHRIAVSCGGSDDSENANWLCRPCHAYKSASERKLLHHLSR